MEDLNESGRIAVDMSVMATIVFVLVTILSTVMIAARDQSQKIINASDQSFSSKISAMENYTGSIPAATLFSVLTSEEADVKSVTGMVNGERINSIKDLTKVFPYKVYVAVSEDDLEEFSIVVRGESD